ncbi:MAG: prepilin-type N-terminal cleavage/methylation domain-containing protein [Deltaproteobacteria bacterium]|nr:prepilin-type N-terminal cleavage/methylation domain-containing protein [Deltaproteobacteria bacterium]
MIGRMHRRGRAGFTLIEVLVSMAILSMVLVVLLQNHGMSIRLSERARKSSIAANLARDLMTEVELEGFPEIGVEEGDFTQTYPGLYPGFVWQREVNESIFLDYIREVTVRVSYMDGDEPRVFELMDIIAAKTSEDQDLASATAGSGGASPFENALMGQYGGGSESGGTSGTTSGGEDEE